MVKATTAEEKEEMREEKKQEAREASGLLMQVKSLVILAALALVSVCILLSNVFKDELIAADQEACRGARDNKCERSDPWRWGNTQSFGVVWSYRLLSSSWMALQFFALTLFVALALFTSLCTGMQNLKQGRSSDNLAMKLFYFIHDAFALMSVASFFIGLVYFLFAVEALIHVKFPSYQPAAFWNEDTQTITETLHNPPFRRYLEIWEWFTIAVALFAFVVFKGLSKIPGLVGSVTGGGEKKTSQPPADLDEEAGKD